MRLLLSSALVLVAFGCTSSHGVEDASSVPDSARRDGGSLDSCVPPPCPAPPEGCFYDGGDACSCGEIVCDSCGGPIVDCAPPPPGCDYLFDEPCGCGTLACDDAGVADGGLICPDVICEQPEPFEGCRWIPTYLACCDVRLECETCDERFPEFDNACTTDAECTIAMHRVDCCGSVVAKGIRRTELDRFTGIEDACNLSAPECDCIPTSTLADDGTTGTEFVVNCTTVGICVTSAS